MIAKIGFLNPKPGFLEVISRSVPVLGARDTLTPSAYSLRLVVALLIDVTITIGCS